LLLRTGSSRPISAKTRFEKQIDPDMSARNQRAVVAGIASPCQRGESYVNIDVQADTGQTIASVPLRGAGIAQNPGGHAAAVLHNGSFERIDPFGAELTGVGD